ncbi:Ig-like domain-containing protein, partial [Lysinibacter cavernae]|uniref:Ig-like domain-containing protein n=1 Tax=Lysinibacter cavernae TaxID=1640652 RepID=UPI003609B389
MDLVSMDNMMRGQLGSPSFATRAYFNSSGQHTSDSPATNGGVVVVDSSGSVPLNSASGTGGTQAAGGTGTAADPFRISTTRTIAGSLSVTKQDSYVLGSGQVRTDLSYTNLRSTPASVQMAYWVDSYFAGSDRGKSLISAASVSNLASVGTAASSFVAVSPSAKFLAGHYDGVRTNVNKYNSLTNKCHVTGGGVAATCDDNNVDNGMAIGWMLDGVAAGATESRTYFATFADNLRFADIDADVSVSTSTAKVGEPYEYVLTVRNSTGPETADSVVVDFPLPYGVALTGQSGTGSFNPDTGTWTVGGIAIGDTASITLTVEPRSAGIMNAKILNARPLTALDITPHDAAIAPMTTVEVLDGVNPSASTVAATPTTVTADGVAYTTVTVSTFALSGAPITTGGANVRIDSTLGQVGEITDNGDGTYSARLSSSVAGTAAIAATIDDVPVAGPSLTFVPGAPMSGPEASFVTMTAGDNVADGVDAHTVTVAARDATGNLVSGIQNTLSAAAEAGVTVGSFTEITPGVYSAPVVSTTAGRLTVTVASGSVELGSAEANFIAGPVSAANSVLVLTGGDQVADGVESHTATVIAKDAHGNVLNDVPVTFTVAGNATGSGEVLTDGQGQAIISVTSTMAGAKSVSAQISGAQVSGAGTVSFIAGSVDASQSVFSVTPGTVLADGIATHAVTVVAKDAHGNPVSGVNVDFVIPAGVHATTPGVTDVNGFTTVVVTSTTAGTYPLAATIDAAPLVNSPQNVSFKAGAATAENSSWTLTPVGAVIADGTSAFTAVLTARDVNGNPVEGAVFTVDVPGAVIPSVVDWITGADGTVAGTFTSVTAGTYPATLNLGGDQVGATRDMLFRAGPVSEFTSTIVSDKTAIKADGTTQATITVVLKDAFGNIIDVPSNPNVVMDTTAGTLTNVTATGMGTFTGTLTGSKAGTATVTYSIDGTQALNTVRVTLINAVPPEAPVVNPSNGTAVRGVTVPGATVTIRADNGTVLGTGTAAPDGSFNIALDPIPGHSATISLTGTDADGNESVPTEVVVDSKAPDAPVVNPSDGGNVTGSGEPGATVVVKDDGGNVIGSGVVDENGKFDIKLSPVPGDGKTITVAVTDPAGNESVPTEVVVDSKAPDAPVVNPSNGLVVTGYAEPGSWVTMKDFDGNVIGAGRAGLTGEFIIELNPAAATGEVVTGTATDAVGNESAPADVPVNSSIPLSPVVKPTNGQNVTGQATPHITVTIRDENGNVLGAGVTDNNGNFNIVLAPVPSDGAQLNVTVTNEAGTDSAPTLVAVDAVAPAAPSANPTDGRNMTGKAEPGASVTITDDNGTVLGSGTALPDGTYLISLSPVPGDGKTITVAVTDPAGNESVPTEVVVDSKAPDAPVVNPSDGG